MQGVAQVLHGEAQAVEARAAEPSQALTASRQGDEAAILRCRGQRGTEGEPEEDIPVARGSELAQHPAQLAS